MKVTKQKITKHLKYDRAERYTKIVLRWGIGEVVKRKVSDDGICTELTDTGVIFIRVAQTGEVVTIYTCDIKLAKWLYGGQPIPAWLKRRCKEFTKEGFDKPSK